MIDAGKLSEALYAWRTRFGENSVLPAAAAQRQYGATTTGVEHSVAAAVQPVSVDDVVAIVDIARCNAIPLYAISTGHNWGYGSANPATDGCVVVDLSRLDRVVDMDAELGLVTVEPGVTQQGLHDYLQSNGLAFLVPVTGAGPRCSLVGNALERGYGITPYTDHFHAVTALEAVLPDGRIYRSALGELGGETVDRAFKWGIGPYIDGLFAQSNFAIVTQMTFALAPRPERTEAFFFGVAQDAGLETAVAAVQRLLRSIGGVTGSINLMNARRMLAMMAPYPHTRVGDDGILPSAVVAELAGENRIAPWTGFGALYGHASVVRAARAAVRETLKPVATRLAFYTPESASRLNRWLGRVPGLRHGALAGRARTLDAALQLVAGMPSQVALPLAYWRCRAMPSPGSEIDPDRDGCGLIWYPPLVPMKPDKVRRYVEIVTEICTSHRIEPLITLTSLSDRCFDSSVPLLFDRSNAEEAARAQACYWALLDAGRSEGFLPYRMNAHAMDWLTRSEAPFWDVVAAIKRAIDPTGIIAPGRYARPS
jgi:4-cresol dehydrogenase (hydroxylating) flavoprotein subunit